MTRYTIIAKIEILGQPPRKSNSRRMIPRKGLTPPRMIKSQEALDYIESFLLQFPAKYRDRDFGSLKENLRLDIIVWYRDRRADLSIELIKDCIEESGLIKNDRYIREEHVYGFVDKENPRIKFNLMRIKGERILPFA